MPMADSSDGLNVVHLGLVPYAEGLRLQERLRDAVEDGRLEQTLLLLEHEPACTVGRRSGEGELAMDPAWYAERGIGIFETDRGGKVTYHAPGQLVGYPVMRVTDPVAHVRAMEEAIVATLASEGIGARSRPDEGPDFTGVWVGERKIASIGVHVRRGISTHGFAINAEMEMEPWSWIVPCGLSTPMTSTELETGRAPLLPSLRRSVATEWARRCGLREVELPESELRAALGAVPAGAA